MEEYLAKVDEPDRAGLLQHLLRQERHYRCAAGEAPCAEEYVQRFPERAVQVHEVFAEPIAVAPPHLDSPPVVPGVLGDYEVLERLGEGGMGTVYKACHRRLKRVVAIKVLRPEWAHDARARSRFAREMEAVGRVNHANVVQAMDAREEAGLCFLVMEYVEGMDVAKVVAAHGRLRVEDACEIARQAAVALEHAYRQGLVHRDLKPSNLMLTPEGTVKVLDLGLARIQGEGRPGGEATTGGVVLGTVDYISPEQIQGARDIDIRADLYSLGCTLYHLLAGRPPFGSPEHPTDISKLMAHVQEPFPSIEAMRGDVPGPLQDLLSRLAAKNRADRPATPAEVVEALRPLAAGCNLPALLPAGWRPTTRAIGVPPGPAPTSPQETPSAAPTPPSPSRGWSARRTSRKLAYAAVAVSILACAAVFLFAPAWMSPRGQPIENSAGPPASEVALRRAVLFVRRQGDDHRIQAIPLQAGRPEEPSLEPLRPGDDFGVHAEFSDNTYWYLAWLDTKGVAQIVARAEQPAAVLDYPPGRQQLVGVDPQDPPGLHLLLLLTSDRPPAEVQSTIERQLADLGPPPAISPGKRVSEDTRRGPGQVKTTTARLDADYFQRIEGQLPSQVRCLHRVCLPAQTK